MEVRERRTEGEVVDEENVEGMRRQKMKRMSSMEGEGEMRKGGETVWL